MIDYKVGDWVETCSMLPGIVQEIDVLHSTVRVFYPHKAFDTSIEYYGYSECSTAHCGVHKVTPEYAIKLMMIGENRLIELWNETSNDEREWPEIVEEEFAKIINKS